ncbi:g1156 [Coccomyxa elongata]
MQPLVQCLATVCSFRDHGRQLHTCNSVLAAPSDPEPDWADDSRFQADGTNFTPHVQQDSPMWDERPSRAEPSHNKGRPQRPRPLNYKDMYLGDGSPTGNDRKLLVYQMLATDVAAARRTYLIRDILEEMQLNGVAPDAQFLVSAIKYSLQSTRVGDCFYYFEEMRRRGMQPSERLKGSLMSVLARNGDLDAAMELWKDVKPAEQEGGFELSLAIVNAYGEQGNVEGVRRQLSEFIDLYRDVPYALTYGYTALIKAYRKNPSGDREQYAREVLAALAEAEEALAASQVPQKGWPLPVGALFALQKYGCHEAVVELFERMPMEIKENPQSWAYTHTVMSYIKDATGIFRWPRSEKELRNALKVQWSRLLNEKHAAQGASQQSAPDQVPSESEQATAAEAPEQATAAELPELAAAADAPDQLAAADAPGENVVHLSRSDDDISSSSEDDDVSDGDNSDDDSDYDETQPEKARAKQHARGLKGPAGEALKLARIKDLRWVPRQEYSRLRYMHLKGLANPESWQKAIELHAEMNSKGLELPASEMLEFIEASIQMEAMDCKGALQIGIDLLDRFGQVGFRHKFINSLVGSHLLRFASQRHVGDLSLSHKLWDALIAQGDVPERTACRAYMMALEQREPDSEQLKKVMDVVMKEYGVINRPKGKAKMKAEREALAAAALREADLRQ